jgi:hypothetical protein
MHSSSFSWLAIRASSLECAHWGAVFHHRINDASERKRKEHLRTIGMGGIRNASMQISSSSNARGETIAHAFLHVPTPTALRTSLSSSSLLTKSHGENYYPGTLHVWRVCIYRTLLWRTEASNAWCTTGRWVITADDSGTMWPMAVNDSVPMAPIIMSRKSTWNKPTDRPCKIDLFGCLNRESRKC